MCLDLALLVRLGPDAVKVVLPFDLVILSFFWKKDSQGQAIDVGSVTPERQMLFE
jgi:hypothetical protein